MAAVHYQLSRGYAGCTTDPYGSARSKVRLMAYLLIASRFLIAGPTSKVRLLSDTIQVRGKALRSVVVVLSIALTWASWTLEAGSLYCRSALHLSGMEEIALAVVLDGSRACSADMPWSSKLVPTNHSGPCTTHCCSTLTLDCQALGLGYLRGFVRARCQRRNPHGGGC